MKIWNSGTGIILIFWSLFSFWFGRRRRKSRRFEKLSGNLDKSPIKIPLGCIIQRQEFGSPRWMGVSVHGSQRSWLSMHAQSPELQQSAQWAVKLPISWNSNASSTLQSTSYKSSSDPHKTVSKFLENPQLSGRSKILDKYDLHNLRAFLLMSRIKTINFHENFQWLKHIQDNRRISVNFSCLWARRLHLKYLSVLTTYAKSIAVEVNCLQSPSSEVFAYLEGFFSSQVEIFVFQ